MRMHAKALTVRRVLASVLCPVLAVAFAAPADSETRAAKGFCAIPNASAVADIYAKPPIAERGLRFLPSQPSVGLGHVVKARLLNFAESSALYGSEFVIQLFGSEGWNRDPASPEGPWPRGLSKLHQGEAGRCFRFLVPPTLAVGRYRFLTKVTQDSHRNYKAAEFRVVSR